MASSSATSGSPCAACKFLRRKCMPGCIFAPYFPPEDPQKFANVHKIFGASNVTKLLNELLPHQREDAVNSLAYEAEARVKDPVYGCVGAISVLQRQVQHLQKELEVANANLIRYATAHTILPSTVIPPPLPLPLPLPPPPFPLNQRMSFTFASGGGGSHFFPQQHSDLQNTAGGSLLEKAELVRKYNDEIVRIFPQLNSWTRDTNNQQDEINVIEHTSGDDHMDEMGGKGSI